MCMHRQLWLCHNPYSPKSLLPFSSQHTAKKLNIWSAYKQNPKQRVMHRCKRNSETITTNNNTYLPTKLTKILAMLTDLHFLNLLSQTSPIAGTWKQCQIRNSRVLYKEQIEGADWKENKMSQKECDIQMWNSDGNTGIQKINSFVTVIYGFAKKLEFEIFL